MYEKTDRVCPIRGHAHTLRLVRKMTQLGTGKKAQMFQCPFGNYRWFVIEGCNPEGIRLKKPRWGWKA